MKAETLRQLADKIHSFSFRLRGLYSHKERPRPIVLLSVKIQSFSDWLDKRAYIKENGQLPQAKEVEPFVLNEETLNEIIKELEKY